MTPASCGAWTGSSSLAALWTVALVAANTKSAAREASSGLPNSPRLGSSKTLWSGRGTWIIHLGTRWQLTGFCSSIQSHNLSIFCKFWVCFACFSLAASVFWAVGAARAARAIWISSDTLSDSSNQLPVLFSCFCHKSDLIEIQSEKLQSVLPESNADY